MRKRLLSIVLAALMVVGMLPMATLTVFADDGVTGSGTKADPYVVTTWAALKVVLGTGGDKTTSEIKYVKLGADFEQKDDSVNNYIAVRGKSAVLDFNDRRVIRRFESTKSYAILVESDFTIYNSGTLDYSGIYCSGKTESNDYAQDPDVELIRVKSGTFTLNSGSLKCENSNHTYEGYAIYMDGGNVVLNGGTLKGGRATAIYHDSGDLTINDCYITNNTSLIYSKAAPVIKLTLDGGNILIKNCTIRHYTSNVLIEYYKQTMLGGGFMSPPEYGKISDVINPNATITIDGNETDVSKLSYIMRGNIGVIKTAQIDSMSATINDYKMYGYLKHLTATTTDSKYTVNYSGFIGGKNSVADPAETHTLYVAFKPASGYTVDVNSCNVKINGKTATYSYTNSDGSYVYYINDSLGYYTISELRGSFTRPQAGQTVSNVKESVFCFTHLGRSGYSSIESLYTLSDILQQETTLAYFVDNGETNGSYEWDEMTDSTAFKAGHDYTVFLYYKTDGYDNNGYELDPSAKLTVTGTQDSDSVAMGFSTKQIPGQTKNYEYAEIYMTFSIPAQTGTGVTVSGAVTSYNDESGTVTLELIKSGETEATATTTVTGNTGNYTFNGIAAGDYTLRVSKANHVTRDYEITVGAENLTQDVEICLKGDVDNDGSVTGKDWTILKRHLSGAKLLEGYNLLCGDVDGDNSVTGKDWTVLKRHLAGTKTLW